MGLALLFPGQGTQHPQMLPWLEGEPAAAPMLGSVAGMVGSDWRVRLESAEWASRNAVAQPLLVGVELAAWACLAPQLPVPVAVAGYSVGELAACAAAGVFDAHEALRLVVARASAMDRSVQGVSTALLAVRDVPLPRIAQWCERHGLAVAIRLGPDRAIVGGLSASLEAARADALIASGRVSEIGVRIASHTPWMAPAVDEFAAALATVPLRDARRPVVCNLTGAAVRRAPDIAYALAHQIATTVLWDSCMETLVERGVTCVLEVGPGTTLSTMWRTHAPEIPCRSLDEFRSASAVVEWVGKVLA